MRRITKFYRAEMDVSSLTMHLSLERTMLDGATVALIPGDPGRVPRMARQLQNARELAHHREFRSYAGVLDSRPVVVCSTGIGGPSTAICIEELAQLGIRTFLRVGTTGTIQPHIAVGDLIISQAAVRLEGTSQHFAPIEYPAVADHAVTNALIAAAAAEGLTPHLGITVTSDTFYPGQERYDTYTGRILPRFHGAIDHWRQLGALNFEMEAATVFVVARSMGLKAGCVLGVVANRTESEQISRHQVEETEARAIRVALRAAVASS
jgi:uridine phosphorylase